RALADAPRPCGPFLSRLPMPYSRAGNIYAHTDPQKLGQPGRRRTRFRVFGYRMANAVPATPLP
ncbi:MAG: hypothetical protein AAFQ99_14345, partial [Pseudomonadota bacterium]